MSRFHPVRPRPKHQQVPSPAAPAQPNHDAPSQAQLEAMHQRVQAAAEALYQERGGAELDASITRCRKLLAIHDRELESLASHDFSQPHRWTVSPSIAFRFDKLLHELLGKREQLQAECLAMVKHAMAEIARAEGDDSLCPPKSPQPAQEAASKPDADRPPPQEPAEARPRAA